MSKSSKKRKKLVYNVCMFMCGAIFIGCLAYLISYFWQSKKSEDRFEELKDLIVQTEKEASSEGSNASIDESVENLMLDYININGVKVQLKFSELYMLNSDFIGWLSIDGTEIDYPVMQTMEDEEFYIHKDFDKEYSLAGTLFVDTDSNIAEASDNILIYGHNMKTGKMFHDLLKYEDEEFYKEHKYISFDTIYGDATYEVIAAYRTKIYTEDYTGFKYYQFFDAVNAEHFNSFVDNSKALTCYDISATAQYGDSLLTLSTCAYHTDDGRFVVVAKKID